jgi:hypothetical protein
MQGGKDICACQKSQANRPERLCKIAPNGGFLGFKVTIERNFRFGLPILMKMFKERRRTHDHEHAADCCLGNPSGGSGSDLAIQQELGVLSQRPSRPGCANRVVASSNRPSVVFLLLPGLETMAVLLCPSRVNPQSHCFKALEKETKSWIKTSVLIQSVNARLSPESRFQRMVRITAATSAPRQEVKIQISVNAAIPDARELLRQVLFNPLLSKVRR